MLRQAYNYALVYYYMRTTFEGL